ncbi:MAG TPA: metalloregulator ArsR/SmtB family transcription factor [Sphingomicrobium sp.]|nr:metalloregulator ArsR/SmtB family transcription factor [Sphingomicrobium sp.]
MEKVPSPAEMAASAGEASALLKTLANEHRLLILCHLIAEDEMPVRELVSRIGLSQSALSQHLGRLRDEGLVGFRRDAQTLFYRVCDERAARILLLLNEMFCAAAGPADLRKSRMAPARPRRDKVTKGD